MWVFDNAQETVVNREITFVPGLYKIFDEILVNAADHKVRDKTMTCIKIDITPYVFAAEITQFSVRRIS
jgi:DNA topoisomerase II